MIIQRIFLSELRKYPEFENHAGVYECRDALSGLHAIIAVHDTTLGQALGGCRRFAYASKSDAIADALRLSASMTNKAAGAELHLGGGKAVIIAEPLTLVTKAQLHAMGEFVESLEGDYIIAEDVGIGRDDLAIIAETTQYADLIEPYYIENGVGSDDGDSGVATAMGVYHAWSAARNHAKHKYGGVPTVAIQGLGSVGYSLAKILHEQEDAVIYASDTNEQRVRQAQKELGATIVTEDEIFSTPADFFMPCAMGGILNPETIPLLANKIVVGAANNQLADIERDSALLEKHNVLYVPDFIANAGGIILSVATPEELSEKLYDINYRTWFILQHAQQDSISTHEAALAYATGRIEIDGDILEPRIADLQLESATLH